MEHSIEELRRGNPPIRVQFELQLHNLVEIEFLFALIRLVRILDLSTNLLSFWFINIWFEFVIGVWLKFELILFSWLIFWFALIGWLILLNWFFDYNSWLVVLKFEF